MVDFAFTLSGTLQKELLFFAKTGTQAYSHFLFSLDFEGSLSRIAEFECVFGFW